MRGQTLNTTKDVLRGFPCFVCPVCVASGNSFPGRGAQRYRVPGPGPPQTSDFFPCHSFLTSSPVRHTASPYPLLLLLGCGRPAEVSGFPLRAVPVCTWYIVHGMCVPGSGLLRQF